MVQDGRYRTGGFYAQIPLSLISFTDFLDLSLVSEKWDANGTLSLIDRIKNLVKLRSGEYLALEKLESVYGSTDIVQNTLIYANSDADRPVALVVPVSAFRGLGPEVDS